MLATTTIQILNGVVAVVALVAAPAMARAWRRVAARSPRIEGDKLVLRHAGVYVVVVLAVALVLLGMTFSAADLSWVALPWWLALPIGALLLAMPGIAVAMLLSLRVRVEFDAHGLRGRRALSGFCELRWSDIVAVRYSKSSRRLVVRGAVGQSVVAYAWMPGFPVLLEQLRNRVPEGIAARAIGEAASDPFA